MSQQITFDTLPRFHIGQAVTAPLFSHESDPAQIIGEPGTATGWAAKELQRSGDGPYWLLNFPRYPRWQIWVRESEIEEVPPCNSGG